MLAHAERWHLTRLLAIGALTAVAACAQAVVDTPKKIEDARKLLDSVEGRASGCGVVPIGPRFNFTLRLQAGYVGQIPLRQAQTPQKWVVLARITPQQGEKNPVYLSDVVQFPARSNAQDAESGGFKASLSGAFWLGEGRYRVKWLAFDGDGDVCRKEWQIDASLKSNERKIGPLMAPNTVAAVSAGVEVRPPGDKPALGRLTILLHAASLQQGENVVGPIAKGLLLDALIALMDQMPAGSVRLVVFNLDQQKEIWRKDGFTLEALQEVAKALDEPGAVNYRALQNSGGALDLVESLTNQEIHASEPSGAVVFLGPHSIYRSKPVSAFTVPPGAKQRFFYLLVPNTQARRGPGLVGRGGGWPVGGHPPGFPTAGPNSQADDPDILLPNTRPATPAGNRSGVRPNNGPDTIQFVVEQLGGKVLKVDSPDSFANAVAEMKRMLGTNR